MAEDTLFSSRARIGSHSRFSLAPPLAALWRESLRFSASPKGAFFILGASAVEFPVAYRQLSDQESTAYNLGNLSLLLFFCVLVCKMFLALAVSSIVTGATRGLKESLLHAFKRIPACFGAISLMAVAAAIMMLISVVASFLIAGDSKSGPAGVDPALLLIWLAAVFIMAIRASFVFAIASEQNLGPVGIVRASWVATKGYYGLLFRSFFLLVVLVVALILVATVPATFLFQQLEIAPYADLLVALIQAAAGGIFTVLGVSMAANIYIEAG